MPKHAAVPFDPSGYATVAERISLFYERYPAGRVQTELVSRVDGEITFRALVYRELTDPVPAATGWASEREGDGDINAVACLENTETSAIGRALANLGFTASTKRPSMEEMQKAERARRRVATAGRKPPSSGTDLPGGDELQAHADAAHDLLDLVASAERRGFPQRRATIVRKCIQRVPPIPPPRVRALEGQIRGWLRRQGV